MSRSNSTELINPAVRYYEWSGDTGGFRFFDKTKGELVNGKPKGEKVAVPLPFRFMVLDTLSTVKGFSDEDQSGFWANEIRDIKKDILTVRNKKGQCAKGLYEQVMTDRNCVGAKYSQSVYIAYKDPTGFVIANIQMVGSCLSAWIDFRKKNKVFEGAISVDSMIEGKKGKTVYQIPVFKKIEVSPESDVEAKHLDVELQNYLDAYLKRNNTEVANQHVEEKIAEKIETPVPTKFENEEVIMDAPSQDLPF